MRSSRYAPVARRPTGRSRPSPGATAAKRRAEQNPRLSIHGLPVRLGREDDSLCPKEEAVKYLIQIYGNITRDEFEAMSADEKQATYAAWGALNQHPGVTPGLELADPASATTVRFGDGEALTTDGPFIETKEALGGY